MSGRPEFNPALAADIAAFTHDPLGHALYAYEWGKNQLKGPGREAPRKWQKEVMSYIGEQLSSPATRHSPIRIAVVSGHGVGKSSLIGMIMKWAMDTCEDTRIIVTANTEPQLRQKTWPEIGRWFRGAINSEWFQVHQTSIASAQPKHEQSWRADAVTWSEHNTEAFAGLHNAGKRIVVVYDEASSIADKVWEVTEGALTDEGTEIIWLAFGNGTRATGRFRECFRRNRHRWKTWHIDARNVEGTNKELIDEWITDHGEDSDFCKIRVRGMFPSLSTRQYISSGDVDAAYGRHLAPQQYEFAPVVISCDPAWEGDDELVVAMRQGLHFKILHTMAKNDNDVHVANIIARYEDEYKADMVNIDGGYGTGIVSAGTTMGRAWNIVWFSAASADPGCFNKRAEMYKLTRDWLKAGGSLPEDEVLKDELTAPETVPRLDGKIQIESKDSMKRRGLASPNRADALVLTFAYPVAHRHDRPGSREHIEQLSARRKQGLANYDPNERWLNTVV